MSATFTSASATESVIPTTAAAWSGHYHESNPNGTALIAVSITALVFTYFVVGARLYTKIFLTRALGWDDGMLSVQGVTGFIILKLNFSKLLACSLWYVLPLILEAHHE